MENVAHSMMSFIFALVNRKKKFCTVLRQRRHYIRALLIARTEPPASGTGLPAQ
jgi:hypothetical protein